MPQVKPKVTLLEYTPNPERTVALAAKLCYSDATIENLQEGLDKSDINKFIEQGEKNFIDIDDAIEAEVKNTHNIDKVIAQEEEKVVQDITQEDILNVNQSLEELCRELGIGDSEEE